MTGMYLKPKSCPNSLPNDPKVPRVRVTVPLIFLGEISVRYKIWILALRPKG